MRLIPLLKRVKRTLYALKDEAAFRRWNSFVHVLGFGAACSMMFCKAIDILTGYRTSLYNRRMEAFCIDTFRDIAETCEDQCAPPAADAHNLPIPVYCLWWDGMEHAPECVKRCVASHRQWLQKPTFVYFLLTKDNLRDFVTLPDAILQKFESGAITLTHLSDCIRAQLLAERGGLWLDATLLLTGPFDDAFFHLPFYSNKKFTYAENTRKLVAAGRWTVYFLKASKGNPLAVFTFRCWERYWQRYDSLFEYYLLDYLLHTAYRLMPSAAAMIDAVPENNPRTFDLYEMRNAAFDSGAVSALLRENVIHKFSYKDVYRLHDETGAPTVWQHLLTESEPT